MSTPGGISCTARCDGDGKPTEGCEGEKTPHTTHPRDPLICRIIQGRQQP